MCEGEDVGGGVGLQDLVLGRQDGGESVEPHDAGLNIIITHTSPRARSYQEDHVEDGEAFENVRKCRLEIQMFV